jgi:hypothetical protein
MLPRIVYTKIAFSLVKTLHVQSESISGSQLGCRVAPNRRSVRCSHQSQVLNPSNPVQRSSISADPRSLIDRDEHSRTIDPDRLPGSIGCQTVLTAVAQVLGPDARDQGGVVALMRDVRGEARMALLQVQIAEVFAVPGCLLGLRSSVVVRVVEEGVEEGLGRVAGFRAEVVDQLVNGLKHAEDAGQVRDGDVACIVRVSGWWRPGTSVGVVCSR